MWKLADFGYTTQLQSRSDFLHSSNARGTEGYFAPEFVVETGELLYNTKVDIWSTGCILFEFAVGKQAFPTSFALFECKVSRSHPPVKLDEYFSDHCKGNITQCISMMLQVDAKKPPTAPEMIEHFRRYLKQCYSELNCGDMQMHQSSSLFIGDLPSNRGRTFSSVPPTLGRSSSRGIFLRLLISEVKARISVRIL